MNRLSRIPSVFTRFPQLLALRDRLAGLFRTRHATAPVPTRLGLESMEERLVPEGRPLPFPVIFAGSDAGSALVTAYNADTGTQRWSVTAFGDGFAGGVRVAAGDVTGDGIPDAIVAPGSGRSPQVRVLDGISGAEIGGSLGSFLAFGAEDTGGVFVASGDVNGDGRQDVIVAALTSAGPRVKAFSGTDGAVLANFAVPGAAFAGGITVAAADFTGDRKAEVVVGGSGGRVLVYDPLTGSLAGGGLGERFLTPFGTGYTGTVFVGADERAGDTDGDGVSDLAVGTGPGVTAQAKVLSGATGATLYDINPFGVGFDGGVRVGLAYVDDDDRADLVVGSGPGTAAQVKVFSGATGTQLAAPLGVYSPFGGSLSGTFIAASNDPTDGGVLYYVKSINYHGTTVDLTITYDDDDNEFQWNYTVTNTAFWGSASIYSFTIGLSSGVEILAATNDRGWYDPSGWTTSSIEWSMMPGSASGIAPGGGVGHFSFTTRPTEISQAAINLDSSSGFMLLGPGEGIYGDIPLCLATLGLPCFDGEVVDLKELDAASPQDESDNPIRYVDGVNRIVAPGLSSDGLGAGWGTVLSWSNDPGYSVRSSAGNGWVAGDQSRLYQLGVVLYLVTDASTATFFDGQGTPDANGNYATYAPRFYNKAVVAYDGANDQFVVTAGDGTVYRYLGFGSARPALAQGAFQSRATPGGLVTQVTSRDTTGRPLEIQSAQTVGGVTTTESYVYTYLGSGNPNAGKLDTVTLRQKVGVGAWSTVRQVSYAYYGSGDANGNLGDLKRLTVSDPTGAVIDQRYYRYYVADTFSGATQIGYQYGLKYELGPNAYARLKAAAGGTDASVEGATDATVAGYADRYFEYDSRHRATKETVSGDGCTSCSAGQGSYTYTYTPSSNTIGFNSWAVKTVEVRPDGSTSTVYTNAYGQVMLKAFTDAVTSLTSVTYYRYDAAGRVVLAANPSAVTGYSDSFADLVRFVSGNAVYLSDTTGLMTAYTYATSTTATTSAAGDAAGYLKQTAIRQGETGTAIPQYVATYVLNAVSGLNFVHLATETVYRNDNGTGGQTTSYSYTFFSGTNQAASTTVTLPAVTTAQNGSGNSAAVVVVNDALGRPVWAKDQAGVLSYTQYDTLNGAVVKTITDVDTTQTGTFSGLPSGWSTPSGAGLHLTTSYEVDTLGRATKVTHPNGRVDYTVYNDASHEVRTYTGWDTSTNRPTGPTTVIREDRARGYTETLTMSAVPAVSGGRPTGTESISQVQSLSRTYKNEAGQVIQTDEYFNLGGLSYSASVSLGVEGANFYRTRYEYDNTGQLKRLQTPQGTITRYVRDGLGRVVSEWVGTDDTPTTGYWSPSNTAGTNLVKVREYQYDGGGVGDGNLTTVTEYPGGSAAARVTQSWFDWRNRAVAVKSGVETTESTDVNRPLVAYMYDNLGQVTLTQTYDGDGVTPSISAGVLSLPAGTGTKLRAQTATNFDELGRAFSTQVYSVNTSNGTVSTNSLVTSVWYDARGLVIKQSAPNGLVQKSVYDGAGRLTVRYTTDWGNDTGYADASNVTGETVLEQTEYSYDASGNVLTVTSRERFHDASGTGALGSPAGGIGARVSYAGYYYDLGDRPTASVDVGTNGGSAWSRPGSVPAGTATVLVTKTRYATDAVQWLQLTGANVGGSFTLTFGGQTTSSLAWNASAAAVQSALEALTSIGSGNVAVTAAPGGYGWEVRFTGTLGGKYQPALVATGGNPTMSVTVVNAGGDTGRAAETTDTAGRVSRTYADALGRTVRTVQNFVNGVVSDADDKTVGYTYNGAGMTSLTAYVTGGGGQTTQYLYGVSQGAGSAIDSFDVVGATRWPNPTTGAASASEQEVNTVNALGQTLTATDRNGSVHTLTYDILGRVVSDAVTTLGSGVNGAVRRIETAYDGQGNTYRVTSYDAASGGSIVNQVLRDFNGLGQMVTEWQAHGGAVNTSTSPKVQYAYNFNGSGTTNQSRLTSITYPSGYVLTYNYASGINNAISRLSSLSDSTGTLESYSYLGLGTVVVRAHPQPNVDLSYVKLAAEAVGDAGDQYTGLDRFGRVVDQRWLNPSTGTATDRFQYGYNAAGNRMYRDNLVNTAFGEVYGYDALDQLTSLNRGTLNGTKTGISGAVARSQGWDYDAVGNWDSVTTNGAAQTRTANAQNEITGISGATTPTYDANGNMTGDETGRQFVYDAWNRLVAVKSSGGTTLKTYAYDGLNRRVSETVTATSVTTDLYYSASWQVLEKRIAGNTTERNVWSPVYVDAMVLRDRDTDGDGMLDERLWVQQDANWNVTALVNGSGSVVERYVYDPYGVATIYDASFTVRASSSYAVSYLFQGRNIDSTSGQYQFRNREYSATLGRFTSLDPIRYTAGDVVLYRFVGNSPNNRKDPTGLAGSDWDYHNWAISLNLGVGTPFFGFGPGVTVDSYGQVYFSVNGFIGIQTPGPGGSIMITRYIDPRTGKHYERVSPQRLESFVTGPSVSGGGAFGVGGGGGFNSNSRFGRYGSSCDFGQVGVGTPSLGVSGSYTWTPLGLVADIGSLLPGGSWSPPPPPPPPGYWDANSMEFVEMPPPLTPAQQIQQQLYMNSQTLEEWRNDG
ncbi:RHS repeat-associated core domain-containing protein [Gemmata sp. JC673]|uniref:RHS repeat-associated core domain-containing protein n=1 Tax=Gemmata algarum TaxID=2975278 RepID=A0ABU5ESP7_9BACT|nr:RHS repeat-associated core domain-containing protein [Gemmata algarum]MDY3558363.1 RHS repeat-associated core domain-containing protein [Gemmata algarum]